MVKASSIMGGSPCPCCDDAKPFIGEARSNPGLFHVHPLSGMNLKEFQQEEVVVSKFKFTIEKPRSIKVNTLEPGEAFISFDVVFVVVHVESLKSLLQIHPIKRLENCVLAINICTGISEIFDGNYDVEPASGAVLHINQHS